MKVLALDTATLQATVAVCDGDRMLSERQREVTTHSEGLLEMVHQALSEACLDLVDLDAVVCGQGPGSFTGLRIGMATAKGLCLAADKPLYCVSSLAALAAGVPREASDVGLVVGALIDARRGQLYCGWFDDGQPTGPEVVCAPEQIASPAEGRRVVLVGNGATRYREQLLLAMPDARLAPPGTHQIRAAFLSRAARLELQAGRRADLHQSAPVYLRPPDIRA